MLRMGSVEHAENGECGAFWELGSVEHTGGGDVVLSVDGECGTS